MNNIKFNNVITNNDIYLLILENEKKYSNVFFKNLQIYDERFNCFDYLFIKSFNVSYELILFVIDDLIKEYKNKDLRFLILCDFFFSIFSFEFRDPTNTSFKFSRNNYLYKIHLRSLINIKFGCDYYDYMLIHKKLLLGLRSHNILKKSLLRNKNNNEWITTVYFSLECNKFLLNDFLVVSTFPFIVAEIEECKYSIGSFRNIWKIKRKKKEMDDISISYSSIISANQIGFCLSSNLININKKNLLSENNLLFNEVKCKNIEEYFLKIKKILNDNSYITKLILNKQSITDIKHIDLLKLNKDISNEYVSIIKNFQKIVSFYIINNNNFIDKTFYLPTFSDNRGRQYYGTLISPTFNKIFRYLYEFNNKKKTVNLENSKYYKKIIIYKHLISKFNLNDTNSYFLLILLIEVGKFFISSKNEYMIKTEDIIDIGILNHSIKNKELDFNDLLYLEKIYMQIDLLLNNENINSNTLIFKDATASGLQNYGILLGYKKEKLQYLNINSDNYCDTYQYIITMYLNNKKYCKRKYWKSTIMTIPYNSEWYSCFIKFIDNLRTDNIEYNILSKEEQIEIKNMHYKFYNDVKQNIKKEFYLTDNIDNLKKFNYSKWTIVNKKEYKINYKNLRDKYTNILYMIDHDKDATFTALEANNMHYLDSNLIKEIFKKIEIISIHDCVGVRLCELHLLMDEINQYYSNYIGKETYCIHIIK